MPKLFPPPMNSTAAPKARLARHCSWLYCFALWLPITPVPLHAAPPEAVVLHQSSKQGKANYGYELLNAALKETAHDYGPYTLDIHQTPISRDRVYEEIKNGKSINVIMAPPKPGWSNTAIRVPFPAARGISSYRINLIHKNQQPTLNAITNLEQLKSLSTGAVHHWTTTHILQHHNFNVTLGIDTDALIKMLMAKRFVAFPRGVHEAYEEIERYKPSAQKLEIEKTIVLFTYLPNYFHVSPDKPKLAKRIEEGLIRLHHNGVLNQIFNHHYGKALKEAKLGERKLFTITNPSIDAAMLENDKPYLLDFNSVDHKDVRRY